MEVFRGAEDYAAFVELLGLACERAAVRVIGCCLMPNHFHLIVRPRGDSDLSTWMQWLMTSHVRRHHRRYGTSGHVWQGRYKSFPVQRRRLSASQRGAGVLETDNPVLTVLRYVERNALRAGLVERAQAWPWSSLRWWCDEDSAPAFWRRDAIWRPANWVKIVNRAQTDAELAALRLSVQRSRPFGSRVWVNRVAGQWGLASTLRRRGRPLKNVEK